MGFISLGRIVINLSTKSALDVQCLIINFNIVENSVSSLEAITTQIKVNSAILQYFWTIGTALAYNDFYRRHSSPSRANFRDGAPCEELTESTEFIDSDVMLYVIGRT
ncbi:hypothetical protein V1477_021173 [Vespula maculifrons]|uniref:Uncharacterized protein n=1 Tax=Vespula maculifrons TaxID=7453 RepID=A0ABD2AGX8_VESMC